MVQMTPKQKNLEHCLHAIPRRTATQQLDFHNSVTPWPAGSGPVESIPEGRTLPYARSELRAMTNREVDEGALAFLNKKPPIRDDSSAA